MSSIARLGAAPGLACRPRGVWAICDFRAEEATACLKSGVSMKALKSIAGSGDVGTLPGIACMDIARSECLKPMLTRILNSARANGGLSSTDKNAFSGLMESPSFVDTCCVESAENARTF